MREKPEISESIEEYKNFIAGSFNNVEEAQAIFGAIKDKNFAFLFRYKSEMLLRNQRYQLIQENGRSSK